MGRASQKFNRRLFSLKLAELSRQMQIKSVASDRKAHVASRERGNSLLMHMVGGQLALLRDEWLTGIDRIAREVWQTQGEGMTPDFVREILVPEAMTIIRMKESQIKRGVTPPAPLTNLKDPYPALHHISREIRKLAGEVANRYEIEALELEYRNAPLERALPVKPPKPTQATWRSCADEFKQLADEETRIIRAMKKERLLADCDFDSSATFEQATTLELRRGPDEYLRVRFEALATKAGIALGCANNRAPLKFWLFKLFLYLSETKSHHLFAPTSDVHIGDDPQSDLLKPRAGENLSRVGGIITNVYEASANFCLWLEKQTLEAEHRRGGVDLEAAERITDAVEGTTATSNKRKSPIGRNIDQLRKECGWTFDDLADKTGIDKKNILAHVNEGRKPRPRTMREYAQAFSKEQQRKITVAELEK
ncbi:MAG: helix-turn-helix transcriptional regulator [Candidatus Acidiferrum sp.]